MKKMTIFSLCLMLVACSKVTYENYQRLELGMDYQQVQDLLGEPDTCRETLGNKECYWGSETATHIQVNSMAGKVVFYEQNGLK